ncbi:CHASE2 domain-containing protein [Synechocystis sp. CACIAM 05]|uniref:CHASE2 domain-containing protein n=1 Tax=Synechocystis sp. CACIAM 05 TaxID=1933929 RepID=UPI00138E6CCD|nr:adenylate/guanylate cyclase domain-containing protein [Synechocystis sp. CACIAM 05]QHU99034.1 adenylate/guanylate cyclase domain-containing protein [Synechocystis sp. CACIAM 05]
MGWTIPSAWKRFVWQSRGIWIATPAVTAMVILLRFTGLLQVLEWQSYDAGVRLLPRHEDDRIVIVGIDEQDVTYLNTPIIDDQLLAKILTKLKAQQPAAIGLDLYRDLPMPPGTDELAAVFTSTPNLVGIEKVAGKPGIETVNPPPLLKENNQVGANDLIIDADNIVRRGFIYLVRDGEPHYSFGLHLALRFLDSLKIYPEPVREGSDDFRLNQVTFSPLQSDSGGYIRADDGGFQLLIDYQSTFPKVSLTDVLEDKLPADWGKGKIILLGKVGESFKDLYFTPNSSTFGLSRAVPGVEIHGNIISQILNAGMEGQPLLKSWSEPVEWLWVGLWSFFGAVITWQLRYATRRSGGQWLPIAAIVGSLGALLAISYGALLAGWWLPVIPPMLGLLGSGVFIVTWMARAGVQVRNTFGRYLTDQVVATLLENPEGLKMGGDRRPITILTSDLRGFTSTSEGLNPEEVVKVLNIYFGKMADVITHHGGTIDEFMGDGILVLFGAPTSQEDDALRAVACGVEMQLALREVNQQVTGLGLQPLEMGIGINTGEVVVGNIGSEKRTKYGVVGAQVNLTYRIESYTTGGQIFISSTTLEAAGDRVHVNGNRTVQPKGVKDPVVIWDVAGVGEPYNLSLAVEEQKYVPIPQPLSLEYICLEGKHITDAVIPGTLQQISAKGGFIQISPNHNCPEGLTNIKINLREDGEPGRTPALYAKVLDLAPGESHGFYVHFSAMPTDIAQRFYQLYQGALAQPAAIASAQGG